MWVSFSRTDSGLYIYYLFVWSNVNFLHSSLVHLLKFFDISIIIISLLISSLSILAYLNNARVWTVSIFLQFQTLPVSFPSFWGPFPVHPSQLVLPSLSCSIAFLVLYQGRSTYLFFLLSLIFAQGPAGMAKSTERQILLFYLLSLSLVL